MIKLTEDQWRDLTLVLGSYRAELVKKSEKYETEEHIEFIDGLINEIIDNQDNDNWEVEFEMDWDNPVPDDELDD